MEMIKRYLKDWNTIPNIISYVRILLVPVFAVLFRQGYLGWALVAIVISGFIAIVRSAL